MPSWGAWGGSGCRHPCSLAVSQGVSGTLRYSLPGCPSTDPHPSAPRILSQAQVPPLHQQEHSSLQGSLLSGPHSSLDQDHTFGLLSMTLPTPLLSPAVWDWSLASAQRPHLGKGHVKVIPALFRLS